MAVHRGAEEPSLGTQPLPRPAMTFNTSGLALLLCQTGTPTAIHPTAAGVATWGRRQTDRPGESERGAWR